MIRRRLPLGSSGKAVVAPHMCDHSSCRGRRAAQCGVGTRPVHSHFGGSGGHCQYIPSIHAPSTTMLRGHTLLKRSNPLSRPVPARPRTRTHVERPKGLVAALSHSPAAFVGEEACTHFRCFQIHFALYRLAVGAGDLYAIRHMSDEAILEEDPRVPLDSLYLPEEANNRLSHVLGTLHGHPMPNAVHDYHLLLL